MAAVGNPEAESPPEECAPLPPSAPPSDMAAAATAAAAASAPEDAPSPVWSAHRDRCKLEAFNQLPGDFVYVTLPIDGCDDKSSVYITNLHDMREWKSCTAILTRLAHRAFRTQQPAEPGSIIVRVTTAPAKSQHESDHASIVKCDAAGMMEAHFDDTSSLIISLSCDFDGAEAQFGTFVFDQTPQSLQQRHSRLTVVLAETQGKLEEDTLALGRARAALSEAEALAATTKRLLDAKDVELQRMHEELTASKAALGKSQPLCAELSAFVALARPVLQKQLGTFLLQFDASYKALGRADLSFMPKLPDSAWSASGVFNSSYAAHQAAFTNTRYWCAPAATTNNCWIQVDLQTTKQVVMLRLQDGCGSENIVSFTAQRSDNGSSFSNCGNYTVSSLPTSSSSVRMVAVGPFAARFVRLAVTAATACAATKLDVVTVELAECAKQQLQSACPELIPLFTCCS